MRVVAWLRRLWWAVMRRGPKPRPHDHGGRLDRIEQTLIELVGEVKKLSNQEQELDAAIEAESGRIDALIAGTADLKTAVDALIAAQQSGKVDLTDEIAAVQTAQSRVDDATAAVKGVTDEAVSATPPPAP